jgi:hypothetical protein
MATDDSLLDNRGLMAEIGRLCQQKKTGTLLIATQDNNLARVLLDAGEIVSMVLGQKHGQDVIPLMRNITAGRIKFSEGKAVGMRDTNSLPPTETVLRQLGAYIPAALPAGGVPIGAYALKLVEDELVEFLGPMASLVWNENLDKFTNPGKPENLTKLIDAVAAEIGEPGKIQRFKQQVRAKLGLG